MCGDLATHGFALDTARAEAVAARLEATTSPTFADFYPDGKVEVVRGMKPARALRLAGGLPDEEVVCRASERTTAVA